MISSRRDTVFNLKRYIGISDKQQKAKKNHPVEIGWFFDCREIIGLRCKTAVRATNKALHSTNGEVHSTNKAVYSMSKAVRATNMPADKADGLVRATNNGLRTANGRMRIFFRHSLQSDCRLSSFRWVSTSI